MEISKDAKRKRQELCDQLDVALLTNEVRISAGKYRVTVERLPTAKQPDNLVDCEECDGTGKVEKTCNGCGVVLTKQNVGGDGFGFEGDDVCKKCEAEDEKHAD